MPINRYLPVDHEFDDQHVGAMCDAFAAAKAEIKANHEVLVADDEIANIIIKLANDGEADSALMSQYVLACFGMQWDSK